MYGPSSMFQTLRALNLFSTTMCRSCVLRQVKWEVISTGWNERKDVELGHGESGKVMPDGNGAPER